MILVLNLLEKHILFFFNKLKAIKDSFASLIPKV